MSKDRSNEYRVLPSVEKLLSTRPVEELLQGYSREFVVAALRDALTNARAAIAGGAPAPAVEAVVESASRIARERTRHSLRPAINASGIILHTGLGRAALSEQAQMAVRDVAAGHCTLEVDPKTGKRSSRQDHVAQLIQDLTGAQSALVVNNNAAAVILAVNTLALGKDVIISRGQLVEIGGSFRLPEIIERAGARMVEVGTTNRTRVEDYSAAVSPNTGLILRCHPSNYRISGFVEEVSLTELVELGRTTGTPVVDDLGSGTLLDLSQFDLEREPTVQDGVNAGAGIVTFSGDKLLGASQAGILVGKKELIELCRSNPLARALRVDKLTLAALEATLHIYREGNPARDVPVLASLARSVKDIEAQAGQVAEAVLAAGIEALDVRVVHSVSQTGGGSLPMQGIESRAVALKSSKLSAEDLARHFREFEPPIFGRIAKDDFLLDMRTVNAREAKEIVGCAKLLLG